MLNRFILVLGLSFAAGLWPVLRESDPRLAELGVKARDEVVQKPHEMLLKFQQQKGNFLVFYDYAGSAIYLRFRTDRWDFKTKEIPSRFQSGLTYRVNFMLEGFVFDGITGHEDPETMVKVLEKSADTEKKGQIRPKTAIAVGLFSKAVYILPEILR